MNSVRTDDELLTVTKASPDAVARHDQQAWVGLFSRHAVIEDPVGSRPHHGGLYDRRSGVRGAASIERFYDTFIAPNEITFHIDQDIVARPFVVRDLDLELVMGPGVRARVPMHLVYEIAEEDGALKICHLRAHWEMLPMVRQVLSKGWPGLRVLNRLGLRLLATQGAGAALGFSRALWGIHEAGKAALHGFVGAVNRKEHATLARLFDEHNDGVLFPVESRRVAVDTLCEQVDLSLAATKLISSGYVTSCTFTARSGDVESRGVGLFEFNSRSRRLHAVQLYSKLNFLGGPFARVGRTPAPER
jgi:hypothetical protein